MERKEEIKSKSSYEERGQIFFLSLSVCVILSFVGVRKESTRLREWSLAKRDLEQRRMAR